MCIPILFCACDNGKMPRITLWFRTLPTDLVFARSSRSLPRRTPASECFPFRRIVSHRFASAVLERKNTVSLIFHVFLIEAETTSVSSCAPSRCAGSPGCPFLRWLCVFVWTRIHHVIHVTQKRSNRLQTQGRNSHRYRSRRTTAACPDLVGA